MVNLYVVGPKGQSNPKHPWLMTGKEEIALEYAKQMDGQVTKKEIIAPPLKIPITWREDR